MEPTKQTESPSPSNPSSKARRTIDLAGGVRLTIEGPEPIVEAFSLKALDLDPETEEAGEKIVELLGDGWEPYQVGTSVFWLDLSLDETLYRLRGPEALLKRRAEVAKHRTAIERAAISGAGAPVLRFLAMEDVEDKADLPPGAIIPSDGEVRELGFVTYEETTHESDGITGRFRVECAGSETLGYETVDDLVEDGWRID